MYSALSVANAFIKRGLEGRLPGLTPMKLQKLLFFTQAWYLKVVGEPLIDEIFTRRENGPILPSVYYQLKDYDERIVGQTIRILGGSDSRYEWKVPVLREDDENTWDLIDAIIGSYGHLSPRALSDMTHLPGSAWSQGSALCEAIPNEAIRLDPTIK